jgi:Bacterial Ig domain/Chitobiase/beta-hexosaminidase C-terminal domain
VHDQPLPDHLNRSSVTASLSAADNAGGAGVDKTYYTTDGSTPTVTSPTYVSPLSIAATTTVRFFSTDLAGNVESVKSQTVLVDGAPPSVTLTSPASGTTIKKGAKVTVSASAVDVGTGSGAPSGVAKVSFYLDGSTLLGTTSTSPYRLSWNTASASRRTHSLTAVATDVAGNSRTSASVSVTV